MTTPLKRMLARTTSLAIQPLDSNHTFWLQCFQRAYSRSTICNEQRQLSAFSRAITPSPSRPRRLHQHTCTPLHCPHSQRTARQSSECQVRPSTNSAALPAGRPDLPVAVLEPVSHAAPLSTTSPRRTTAGVFRELANAVENQNLKMAMHQYLRIMQRPLSTPHARQLFRKQYQLLQLIHRTRLEELGKATHRGQEYSLENLDRQLSRIIRDMVARTLNGQPDLVKLANALAQSKAMVEHSYRSDSLTKLQDWRGALELLQDWAHQRSTLSPGDRTLDRHSFLALELQAWLANLMQRLVFSRTHLIRTLLDTIPQDFGIQTTGAMHVAMLKYYGNMGHDGYRDSLDIVAKMDSEGVDWKGEEAVYDYLLYALSHMSGNSKQASRIVDTMLENDLVPRATTMKAAILCAARSGDVEMCSRYIARMHRDWNLSITERMKAVLLYACAKRGDFDGAIEILRQLSLSGTLVKDQPEGSQSKHSARETSKRSRAGSESAPSTQYDNTIADIGIINTSNLLLALINDTHAKRSGKTMTQRFVKQEVYKVLKLFSAITRDQSRVDTQIYTIMMQYLSTLPSPLPGMMYLYKEMQKSENAKPNGVTYRIMLEACAEQMDMDKATTLWETMEDEGIPWDCYVRSSYVRGWGRVGRLKEAEWYTKEGLLAQESRDRQQQQPEQQVRVQGQAKGTVVHAVRARRQARSIKMINLTVVHELMKANKAHDRPARVFEIYDEIEEGKWGSSMKPNEYTLSIALQACSSPLTPPELVDQGVQLVDEYIERQRSRREQPAFDGSDHGGDDKGGVQGASAKETESRDHELVGSDAASGINNPACLSDVNYQLYYSLLGRHHRQRKLLAVWENMMQTVERPPSHLTVNIAMETLENVQWGAEPIRRIQRELQAKWPKVDWASRGRKRRGGGMGGGGVEGGLDDDEDDDRSVGPGGRFWRS